MKEINIFDYQSKNLIRISSENFRNCKHLNIVKYIALDNYINNNQM